MSLLDYIYNWARNKKRESEEWQAAMDAFRKLERSNASPANKQKVAEYLTAMENIPTDEYEFVYDRKTGEPYYPKQVKPSSVDDVKNGPFYTDVVNVSAERPPGLWDKFLSGGVPGLAGDRESVMRNIGTAVTSGPMGFADPARPADASIPTDKRRTPVDTLPVGASKEDIRVTNLAKAVAVGTGKNNPDALSAEEFALAARGTPIAYPEVDYELDKRFSGPGIAIEKLGKGGGWPVGEGPPVKEYDKLQRIREQAAAKGGFKVGRQGSFTQPEVKGISLEQTPEYQQMIMADLDRTWATRRIQQLVARGGLSGSKRDREELRDLIEFEKSNRYSSALLEGQLADASARRQQAGATITAAQYEAAGTRASKAEEKIFSYFDKYAETFKDEDPDASRKVWEIYADETMSMAEKIAALKLLSKLSRTSSTSGGDVEGAMAAMAGTR